MLPATTKCNMAQWITHVISTSTGINGVHLPIISLLPAQWPVFFLLYFSKQCSIGNIQRKFQKIHHQLLFLSNHIKLFFKWQISVSCTNQECHNVTTPCYPIYALFICHVVPYRRLKTKENFKLFALNVIAATWEVIAYKRFHI